MTDASSFAQSSFYVGVILEDLNQTHPTMCAMNLCDLCDFISGKSLRLSKSNDINSFHEKLFFPPKCVFLKTADFIRFCFKIYPLVGINLRLLKNR